MNRGPLPAVVPATWLRVYEPLARFAPDERRRWAGVADQDAAAGADPGERAEQAERVLAWRRLLAGTATSPSPSPSPSPSGAAAPVPAEPRTRPPGSATARVLRLDGGLVACPVPPGGRALVRAWRLPVVWLALAREDDGWPGTPPAPGRYLVSMAVCRDRAAQALRILLGALGEGGVADRMAETAQWLDGFDPRSWVELDARSVVTLVDGDGVDDVRMGLEALDEGDATAVAAAYRRLNRRDRQLDDLSRSS